MGTVTLCIHAHQGAKLLVLESLCVYVCVCCVYVY